MCSINNILTPKNYLGLAEGEFKKQRYYNNTQSFRNKKSLNSTFRSIYGWKIKKTDKETPTLVWEIIQTVVPYTNVTKWCFLCLHKKLAILMYTNQSKLLKKRSELVSKCRHENKFLLQTCNNNYWRKYFYSLMSSNQLNQLFSYSNIKIFLWKRTFIYLMIAKEWNVEL